MIHFSVDSMPPPLRRLSWTLLWLVFIGGIAWSGYRANRQFDEFMEGGMTATVSSARMIPASVSFFAYAPTFRRDWKELRTSRFFDSLAKLPAVQNLSEAMGWNEKGLSPAELWVTRFWGPGVMLGYSEEKKIFLLTSSVGKREACAQWLMDMALDSSRAQGKWIRRSIEGHWCLEPGDRVWTRGLNVQFTLVSGVAVLAMGQGDNPLAGVLAELRKNKGDVLSQYQGIVEQALSNPTETAGFMRWPTEGAGVTTWNLKQENEGVAVNVSIPASMITTESLLVKASPVLQGLRQPDDLISTVLSWEDLTGLWKECGEALPRSWTEPFRQVDVKALMGVFYDRWKPVMESLGHEVFIGLGQSETLSDKYQIPFPRTVVAVPFSEPELFVSALESTVLECNQRLHADLVIRKVVKPFGEYYSIRMGESEWRRQHGLKELPVVGFSRGMLMAAPNAADMEKALSNFFEKSSQDFEVTRGIDLQMDMRNSPSTIRILLASLGAFNSQGENIFLSPKAVSVLSEVFGVMDVFGDSKLTFTHRAGEISLRALLRP